MENLDIRVYIQTLEFKHKDIAKQMGITNVYLSRVLNKQLKPEMRERILQAISDLIEEREEERASFEKADPKTKQMLEELRSEKLTGKSNPFVRKKY